MNILVVSALDAMNLAIENPIKEFISRGHNVEIFAMDMANGTIRMFLNLGVPIHSVGELNEEKIRHFDVAFCCEDAVRYLRYYDIYIFSYNPIQATCNGTGADFMFTIARDRKILWTEDCASMPLGDAKNDIPLNPSALQKQFLYIDAGHNPFGIDAKRQVADMLLDICKTYPDYNLVVKPRWLRSQANAPY